MVELVKILPLIQAELADYLYRENRERLDTLEVLRVNQRPFSVVVFLLARTSNGIRRLVMKTTVHHPDNKAITESENQAIVEYNELQHLYPKFQQVDRCFVPRPILVVPESETYLMDFVEGTLLMDKFRYTRYLSSWNDFHELRNNLNLCGRWLRHFQEFNGVRVADSKALEGVIDRAEHRLNLIQRSRDPRCPMNLRNKVMSFLSEQLKQLSGREILISGRHGDFMPLNVLAGSKGITVIDFLGYKKEPIPVDILKMLVFLEDEMKAISSSMKRVRELKKAFLEGYGEVPYVPKRVLLVCEAMQRIVSLWGHISYMKEKIHHKVETNLCIRNHIRWLTEKDSRKLLWPGF